MTAATSKTILIVGASSGIGQEAARLCQDKGDQVIAADIQPCQLNVPFVHVDIARPSGYKTAIEQFKSKGQRFDAVVITAALHNAYPAEFVTDDMVDQVMNVNLTGHIKFVRDILPLIKDGGKIIAVSSIAAGIGIPMESLYSASKAGLEIFYESLSSEIAYRGITCSLIQPGNVNTGFNEKGNDFKGSGNAKVDGPYDIICQRIHSKYGMSPVAVAQVITGAISSDRPKFCYVVGLNALKAHWTKRLLGRDLTLRVMKRFFGI